MTIFGRVNDQQKSSIIQGATVSVLNPGSPEPVASVQTDDLGRFSITSAAIGLDSIIEVSHPNYHAKQLPVTGASSYGFISLIEKPAAAETETTMEDPQNPSWLLWVVLAAAAVFVLNKKKRRG